MRRFLVAALLLSGCTPNFDPASYLAPDSLRVLGVVANPPDVAPGATATLEPIVAAQPPDSTLTYQWAVCTQSPAAGAGGVSADCVDQMHEQDLQMLGTGATQAITMPALTDPLMFGLPDATTGLYQPVRVVVTAGTKSLVVVYRLRVTLPGFTANHNPVIEDFQDSTVMDNPVSIPEAGGETVAAGSKIKLRITLADGSLEPYRTLVGDPRDMVFEDKVEKPRFFWYSDGGEISDDITGVDLPDMTIDLGGKKHPAKSGETVTVWVVVHDERGGTAIAKRQLHVE